MLWLTLWPLILGFTLAGAVQAFSRRSSLQRHLGSHRPGPVVRASGLGMASSSCSYAAAAVARSLVARGADFVTAMVFMFASTNLVIELGIVLAVLIGWQFAVGELVGGIVMIALLATFGALWLRGRVVVEAQRRAGDKGAGSDEVPASPRTMAGWSEAARYTMGDLRMVRRELLVGYGIAGLLAVRRAGGRVARGVRQRPRVLDQPGERRGRPPGRPGGVGVLHRERPAGRGAVGGRHFVRRGDRLRVRRPDRVPPPSRLPALLRQRHGPPHAARVLGRDVGRRPGHRVHLPRGRSRAVGAPRRAGGFALVRADDRAQRPLPRRPGRPVPAVTAARARVDGGGPGVRHAGSHRRRAGVLERDGETVFFCSERCRDRFTAAAASAVPSQ